MSTRIQSFYRSEKKLYLGGIICGICFLSLYFWASTVAPIYYYFFYTLSAYGLIYIMSYSGKYLSIKGSYNKVIHMDRASLDLEKAWIIKRKEEIKFNRILQTIAVFIGFASMILAFGGYYKSISGGTGAGLLLGSAVWLAIELVSHLQTGEYLQYLNNKRE